MFTIKQTRVEGIDWYIILKNGTEVSRASSERGANNKVYQLTRSMIHGSITKPTERVINYATFCN